MNCLFDNTEHDSVESLHKHLRKFKVKQADYYHEYFPRFDLLTGEVIPYKNYDQYFSQDFIKKTNLKKWIKLNPEKGKEWSIEWLKKRKQEKLLQYPPTQTELMSLSSPTMHYYEIQGGYNEICKSLGYNTRFDNSLKLKADKSIKNFAIIVDTREQNPLNLNCRTEKACLKVGDYALDPANDRKIYIERKSLSDFAGTLSGGYERFTKELDRAVESNSYVVMMVEESIQEALYFDYLPHMRWVKVQPSHVFKQLRSLLEKYPLNFQCLFVDGRKQAADIAVKILRMGDIAKKVDLQYRYELGDFDKYVD